MHVQGGRPPPRGSSYSTGSSCTSTAPVASYHSRTRHGRQHTWQSSTYSCARPPPGSGDRKSTRLNSSHSQISYAVFCLKKKNNSCLRCHREARGVQCV